MIVIKSLDKNFGLVGKTVTVSRSLVKVLVKANLPSSNPYPVLESPTLVLRESSVHSPLNRSVLVARNNNQVQPNRRRHFPVLQHPEVSLQNYLFYQNLSYNFLWTKQW